MKYMNFCPADQVNSTYIQDFLKKYEFSCVSLCSHVRHGTNGIYVISLCEPEKIRSAENIWGIVRVDMGLVYCLPYLKEGNKDFEIRFAELLKSAGFDGSDRNRRISCVDGEKKAASILVSVLEKSGARISSTTEYFLMTKEDDSGLPPPASLLCMGEEIVCCKQEHEDDLYELQHHYLKEEVLPSGRGLSELYVQSSVKAILKNQKVFAIESDGKFVAKVNTNAIGFNWVQIGGVYTDLLYRRNGYSLCLLSTLCRRINKTGRKSVLFVKKKNIPALSLYEKLEFQKSGEFQITYFE